MSEQVDSDVQAVLNLLGNETRMRIVRALWSEFEFAPYVTESQSGMPFGRLRERADVDDPGNFNYHLGELLGTLVADREDGYVLTPRGYNLMRAIDQFAGVDFDRREPWVLADPCPFCDGDLEGSYRRGLVEVRCLDCNGIGGDGNFTFVELPGNGLGDLDRARLLDAAALEMRGKLRSSLAGLCWNCHGRMAVSFSRCDEHARDDGGTCPECLHRYSATVDATCDTCGTSGHGPVLEYAMLDPHVEAAFADVDRDPAAVGPWRYRLAALAAGSQTLGETDPTTVAARFDLDRATVELRLEASGDGLSMQTG